MLKRTNKQIVDTVRMYLANNWPFKLVTQNETLRIESKMGSYTTKNTDYKTDELRFIKDVRQYIIKNQLYVPFENIKVEKPVYHLYGKLKPGTDITDCVNIDIKSAYWATAYKLGLVDDIIYQKGNEVRKLVRLAAIGSLAKKERIVVYDGKTQKIVPGKEREHTAILWDVICIEVGKCLSDIADKCGDDFIYFWVDGIYVKKDASTLVKKMFKEYGYEFSVNKLKKIEVTKTNVIVHLPKAVTDKNGVLRSTKPFPYKTESDRKKHAADGWKKRFDKMK